MFVTDELARLPDDDLTTREEVKHIINSLRRVAHSKKLDIMRAFFGARGQGNNANMDLDEPLSWQAVEDALTFHFGSVGQSLISDGKIPLLKAYY